MAQRLRPTNHYQPQCIRLMMSTGQAAVTCSSCHRTTHETPFGTPMGCTHAYGQSEKSTFQVPTCPISAAAALAELQCPAALILSPNQHGHGWWHCHGHLGTFAWSCLGCSTKQMPAAVCTCWLCCSAASRTRLLDFITLRLHCHLHHARPAAVTIAPPLHPAAAGACAAPPPWLQQPATVSGTHGTS